MESFCLALFMSVLTSTMPGELTVEGKGWIPAGVDPATVPQCGKATELTLPEGWAKVDCRMGNLILRNERLQAEIRLHAMLPNFTQPKEAITNHLLQMLMIRERLRIQQLDLHPSYSAIPLPELGTYVVLPAGDPAKARRFAFRHDGRDFRGKLAAKQLRSEGGGTTDWLCVGRWPAAQDETALRDFQIIYDSVRYR